MAVIQKIRERYAKLAGFVIALSLVAFIVSEGVNNSFGNFFGHDNSVAKVNGEAVDGREYSQMVQDYLSLSELFRKGQKMSEEEQAQLRQQVLQEMIVEKLIRKDAAKIGLQISEQEAKEMVSGNNPDPAVQQFFTIIFQKDQFDPQMIKSFEQDAKKQRDNPQVEKILQQWEALKKYVVRSKLIQKYSGLISGSVYVPHFILNRDQQDNTTLASLRFVKIPYTAINDNEVKVTDADLQDYMKRHKAEFEIDQPSRSIDYVVFDVIPNADDTSKALGTLQKIRDDFASAADNEKFVNRNSEEKYTSSYVTKKTFMSPYADSILNLGVGGVYGPYFEKNSYKLVKIAERRSMPDSVRAKHILISMKEIDDSTAHKRADSIKLAIDQGANFDSLVARYSADEGTKVKGGDLGYFTYGTMVPEFTEASFMGNKGDLKVVKTQFGYHIISITDQKNFQPAVKLATVVKSLNIGAGADQTVFARANEFAGKNGTAAAFDTAVRKEGLNKRVAADVKPNDFIIPGLGPTREMIRWIYEAKAGQVSNPIHLENRYVVAKVSAIQEKGMKVLDATTRSQIEGVVKAEMKAKKITEKYKGMKTLDEIAQAAGQAVLQADSLNAANGNNPAIGYEPRVIGYAFYQGLQPNALSPALKGREGVFYITVLNRQTVPPPTDPNAAKQLQMMAESQAKNAMSSSLTEAMKRSATVSYNPQNIY